MSKHVSLPIWISVFVLICSCACEQREANAGFVATSRYAVELTADAVPPVVSSPHVSRASLRSEQMSISDWLRFGIDRQEFALQNGPTGSMAAETSQGSSSFSPSAILVEVVFPLELIVRIRREEFVWQAPPFSTGVFRPPRTTL